MVTIPKISVIMPAYNAARFLRVAIDSILCQTFTDFELIIINDGSTDNTEEIIRSYTDPRIVYIKNEINLKLIKTLNKGIDAARGEFIARMDSDDQARPTLFEAELAVFEKHPEAGIVNTLTWHMSEDGALLRRNHKVFWLSSQAMPIICSFNNMISHPGVMVRTTLMKKYHYRDDNDVLHLEDKDLWCRMFADGIICITLKDALLNYRESVNSINAVFGEERKERSRTLANYYLNSTYHYHREILMEVNSIRDIFARIQSCNSFFIYLLKTKQIRFSTFLELSKWGFVEFLACTKMLHKRRLTKR